MRRLLLAALLLLLAAGGQALAETVYFRGFIGEEPWQLELSIDGNAVRGRLTHDHLPLLLEAGGSFDEQDSSIVARFGLAGGELSGTLLGEPNTAGTFEGTYLASDTISPFRFEPVARYVDYSYSQGNIQATSTYPLFTSPRLADLNVFVQPDLMAEQIQFVESAQQADLEGLIRNEWWFDSRATVEYASPTLLSVLVTVSDYTGGAHPNRRYWSYNLSLLGTKHRPFHLADLFRAGSDWFHRLERLVLEDLAEQQADWIRDGSVTELARSDLEVFLLTPAGLQFILPPYVVGPWVAGTFTVTVPLSDVSDLLDPGGPVRHLRDPDQDLFGHSNGSDLSRHAQRARLPGN